MSEYHDDRVKLAIERFQSAFDRLAASLNTTAAQARACALDVGELATMLDRDQRRRTDEICEAMIARHSRPRT